MIKKIYKKILRFLLSVFNIFYVPYLHSFCRKQLEQLPGKTQIFLMTRMDFGTFIYLLYYAKGWEEVRGKTCVVILTAEFRAARELAKNISPNSFLINPDSPLLRLAVKVFGRHKIHEVTLFQVYGQLFAEYPHSLRIFDRTVRACYNSFFDSRLKNVPSSVSDSFLDAYRDIRITLNICEETLLDAFHLHYQCGLSQRELWPKQLMSLKKALGFKDNYVVINLNCKTYKEKGTYRKRIQYPERYNCLIDYLIEKDFSIVIQGREEQPLLKERDGLIDYSKSGLCSIENDLALYSGSHFAITSKTGPESFCTVCNTPLLGLNYSELQSVIPNAKLRFFPKYTKSKRQDRYLSWKEALSSPSFFDIANHIYDPDIEFHDLEEEDLLAAVEEFLPLLSQPDEKWLEYTPEQKEFKNFLNPLHLDLYDVKGVPCNVYLKQRADPL